MSTAYGVNTTIVDAGTTKAEHASVGGNMYVWSDTIAAATTDIEAADVIHMAELPSNCKVHSIKLYNDDMDSGTTNTCDVGIYNGNTKFTIGGTSYGAENVIDDDCYASAITDLRGAVLTGTEVAFEARNVNASENFMWEDCGLTEDPSVPLRICLTMDAAGNAAGDITMKVIYSM